MQDWTTFERHSQVGTVVSCPFCEVLRMAREKAPVNEKIAFPGEKRNISVFKTKARTTLHARTEDCRRRRPRSYDPNIVRDVLQL
jgi:hypothetical protein